MAYILLAVIAFGVIHSLLAGNTARAAFRRRFGDRAYEGLYRLLYNVTAVITTAPLPLLLLIVPGRVLWRIEGAAALPLLALQAVGIGGFLVALLQVDQGRFLGLSQLRAYLRGEPLPLPPEPLQQSGMYRLVRHPLYLFSLLVMWPMPFMTDTLLAFNIAATAYFIIGSRLEEKRLLAAFGQAYADYRQRVPWLVPFTRGGG
jgi:protein-S-isoprenylcysteine O-methyltransferase Ste14